MFEEDHSITVFFGDHIYLKKMSNPSDEEEGSKKVGKMQKIHFLYG